MTTDEKQQGGAEIIQLHPQVQAAPKNVWEAMLQHAIKNGQIKEKPRSMAGLR